MVAEHLVGAGLWDCRIGIADGIFAAEQAARRAAPQDCWIVARGGSAAFLAPAVRWRCWTTPTWSPCCAGWASAAWATSPRWRRATC